MGKMAHNMGYNERLQALQDHYIGAYKARRREIYRRKRQKARRGIHNFAPGSEAERVYMEGRY